MPPSRRAPAAIPRVWEVDWAVPEDEGGTPWEAYPWAFETAERLGVAEITIVAATYQNLGALDLAIGDDEAQLLRRPPHTYEAGGVTVSGVASRGIWRARGVVIVAWANDATLGVIEGQRPAAIAAVAQWPDRIPAWLSAHGPERIGQVRTDQEAEWAQSTVPPLSARAAEALDSAGWVNQAHQTLSADEREVVAGALLALRSEGAYVDLEALRAHLMAQDWNGGLINDVVGLAERVARGKTPRHRRFQR